MQDLLKKLTKRKVRINLLDGRLDIQAPKGVMTKALLEEIKLHKSALIDFIESHQNNQDDAQWKIAKAPVQADYPLSSAQKRIWMLCQFAEARQAYNMPCILKMEGPLDVEALNQSFQVLIDRHEALRTQFVENQQGEVRQVILASEPSIFKLEQLDLRFKSTTEEELHSIIQREVNYDFDLTAGRLVRARLIRIADEQFIFCCTLHHIISDGWSTQVMTEELFALYAAFVKGRAHALPPLNIQYKDYTNFLQQYIDQGQMAASRSFWLEQFSGDIPVLAIPTYTTRPATRSYQGNTVRKKFSKQLLSALHEKARRQHITLFMALTALTKLLFYRYTGQSDLIVGTPVSGREHPELQQQIGCYVNALALRTQIDQEDHFDRLLSKVKTTILNAFQHQAYPFDELVAELNLKRDQSRAPLFDVVVSFNKPVGKTGGKTLANTIQLQNYDWGTATMSRFDMELVYEQTSEGLELILTYNTAIYTEVFVKALGEHLEVLLAAVLEKPKKVLHQLEYLSPTEKYRLLEEYNQRVAPFSEAQTIVDLFEARVPQLATQKAVVFQEQELTYEALNAQANQLAHYLRQTFRIQADDIIGIRLKRSEQLIVAILAVIKSGAAYLPMDVQFPEERIAYLQKDSACKTIIDEDHLQNFEAVKEQYRSDNPDKINKASDLAYVIYTSGTTGGPKGVMVEHRQLHHFVHAYQLAPSKSSLTCNVIFDVSVMEIFSNLLSGSCLFIPPRDLVFSPDDYADFLDQNQISHCYLHPMHLEAIAAALAQKEQLYLQRILIGVEPIKVAAIQWYLQKGIEVHNAYGPTECTICATAFVVNGHALSERVNLPIGRPMVNTKVYLLDANLQAVGTGIPGKLYIAGSGLSRGYLKRLELTKEKFIANPFEEGGLMYDSGDVAKWWPDGLIEFMGRKDAQMKIRGHRIEAGEIEKAILNFAPEVQQALVLVKTVNQEQVLVSYYTTTESLEKAQLRQYLLEQLPAYMVPTYYVRLDDFPLTSNGKIDRKALPAPISLDLIRQVYRAPRNRTEQVLVDIWQSLLKIDQVGIDDNFFELGGHSLLIGNVLHQLKAQLGKTLPFKTFFTHSTVASLVAQLQLEAQSSILPAAKGDHYPLTSTQFRFWLLCQLEEINSAYNIPFTIRMKGPLKVETLEKAIQYLLRRHESLRTYFVQSKSNEVRQSSLPAESLTFQLAVQELTPQQDLYACIEAFNKRPFDLTKAPLFAAQLIPLSESEHCLCLNVHHLVSDGWSLQVLIEELASVYNSLLNQVPIDLPQLTIQFKDYACWMESNLGTAYQENEKFWLNELAGELPILNLPTYQARPPVQTYHGSSITHQWTDSLVQRIKTFSGEQRTTVFMTLIAGLNAFLHRYTQQEDIILGTPVAGRSYPELEKQIGLYINTLPIRTRFSGADNFYQLLARQKDILLKVYAHADYPFGELVNQLQLNRDTSRSPIFDVLVTHQKQSAQSWELKNAIEGLECGAYEKVESSVSKFDLTFSFTESDQSIYLDVEYNTDLYQGAFIQQLIRHFTCFLQQCLDLPSLPIRKMEYLEAQELDQLLHGFNQTLVDYTIDQTFVQAFATQVERHPERIALICEGEQISYLDLSQRSNQLAFHLQSLGISTSSIVGLCIGRSIDLLVGILAILKAGATYLPLDPFYPIDRIDYILEHSQTDFVLVDSMSQGILPRTVQAINLDQKDIWTAATLFETPEINAHSMAYVIYTSGSTGRPKGVKVTHRNLMNFLVGMNDQFAFQEEVATWLAVTSISFDISILELLWTLSRGDQIVLDLEKPVVLHPKPQMDFSLFYFPTKQENTATEDKYQLLIEGAKFADQHGFEALWVPERHFHNFGDQFPNPSVAAAAVSTITQQVKLRSGSVVLPLHDPVRVAEEWSMIDHLSKGRVELSIASGWHPNDFVLAPNDYKNRHQLMREKIQTLRSLWRGAALTRKNGVGEDFEFFIHPRPVQAELPIWITAAGSIDTFKYAGSIGGNILTHLLGQSIEDLIEKIKAYRLARKENGFDPEEGKVALMLHTFVGDDPEFVKEVVEQPFKNYLRNSFNLLKPMAEEQGLDFEKDMDVILEMGFLRFYKTGSLFGTPETCLELIQKLFKSGINEIACLIDFGVEEALVIDHFYHLDRLKELVRRAKNQFDYIRGRMQLHDERQSTTALIQEYAISHLQSTPSFYEELLSHEEGRKSIRQLQTLLVGGEALKPALAQKLLALDQSCIYNMYGPTETTIWSAVKKVEDEMVTIGRPIANTQIYILDQAQQICPIGIVGELCIGGDGVSSGYLHRSDLTDERFIPNPFIEGEKIYRTGDLACWLPNGELQFLGRLDSQVKIRGHRIELSEIEAVCLSLTGVNQCVVTTATVNQQVVLIAYLQADENHQETQVKDHLRLRLPHYMIPQYVQFLKDFPKTPNGKVDTKRLPQPGAEQMLSRSFVAPKNQTEEALSQLWADSLQLEKVSVNDNYFEIGGNSMKAFQLLASINTTLEVDLKIISFFQYPTVRTLSDHLRQAEKEQLVLVEDEMENVDDLLDFMSDL